MPELAPLRELISAPKPIKIAHNAKFDAKWVRHHLGVDVRGVFDTLLASQLIAAGDQDRRHNLAEVANFFSVSNSTNPNRFPIGARRSCRRRKFNTRPKMRPLWSRCAKRSSKD